MRAKTRPVGSDVACMGGALVQDFKCRGRQPFAKGLVHLLSDGVVGQSHVLR